MRKESRRLKCQMQPSLVNSALTWMSSSHCAATCFLIQDGHRTIVGPSRFLARVAHRGQPHSSKLAQRAHHVKHHACLAGLTEVEIMSHHDVEKIVRSQRPISGRLDMVAGDKE